MVSPSFEMSPLVSPDVLHALISSFTSPLCPHLCPLVSLWCPHLCPHLLRCPAGVLWCPHLLRCPLWCPPMPYTHTPPPSHPRCVLNAPLAVPNVSPTTSHVPPPTSSLVSPPSPLIVPRPGAPGGHHTSRDNAGGRGCGRAPYGPPIPGMGWEEPMGWAEPMGVGVALFRGRGLH